MNVPAVPPVDADGAVAVAAEEDGAAAGLFAGATPMGFAAFVLAAVAVVGSLYLARGFFVPLLIGILASYALHPLVDWLERCRVPRSLGAALVLAALVGGMGWIGFSVADDAEALIKKLPEAARKLRADLSAARTGAPTALQNMQAAAHELEGAASDAGTPKAETPASPPAKRAAPAQAGSAPIRPPSVAPTWLSDFTLAQSALLASVAIQAPVVLLLAYFLLASGAHFRRKLVQLVGPSLARKKDAVRILEEVDVQVQRYLLAMVGANALLALVTWLCFLSLGLEQAGVWGIAAGVLHFIPYLGPALVAVASGVAAFLQFNSLPHALGVAAVSLLLAGAVGMVFMTWLQSRFARVNAAVLFIALLFFGWLWGAWGLLLGAPLLAIAKVVFDRVEALKPAGELLGR